jgi:methyl-accepting chemotaxis protein
MLNDLLQSKNAPAALILLAAGLLLAVILPALTDFPGWASGCIGLCIGAIAGVLALQGRGANRDELLAIRTGIKAAQRGERASRPAVLTRDLAEVFDAVDNLAVEIESRQLKLKELDAEADKFRGELDQRQVHFAQTGQELLRVMDALASVLADESASTDQVVGPLRQTVQVLGSVADSMEQLAGSAEESSAAVLGLASEVDEFAVQTGALVAGVRDALGAIERVSHEVRELEHTADALLPTIAAASAAMNEVDRQIDESQSNAGLAAKACEQVAQESERAGDLAHRAGLEFKRIEESSTEALDAIGSVATRIDALSASSHVLDDLCEQLNLLALNAAIIAAQAGDHGKGFAVVADGLKDVADRSGATSKEFGVLVRGIGDQTKDAIHAIERSADNVDRGASTSSEAELAAKKTTESAQRANGAAGLAVREAAEEVKSSKQVLDAIDRIALATRQLGAAIGEQARGFEPIMSHAEKVRATIQSIERGQHEQSQRGRQLASVAENIARTIAQLHKTQRSQARTLDEAAVVVERLRELLREHERRLLGLVAVSERLQRPGLRNGA